MAETGKPSTRALERHVVGRQIRGLRLAMGYGRRDFARLVGVNHQTVDRWESGQQTPTVKNLNMVCRVFGVRPERIIGRVAAEIKARAVAHG